MYRFLYERKDGKPAEDTWAMAFFLGDLWQNKFRLSWSRDVASGYVLEQSLLNEPYNQNFTIKKPVGIKAAQRVLGLSDEDMIAEDEMERLKKARRKKAKVRHPDAGGVGSFHKLEQNYEIILKWLKKPRIKTMYGVPYKWLWAGEPKKWWPPLQDK